MVVTQRDTTRELRGVRMSAGGPENASYLSCIGNIVDKVSYLAQ